MKNLAKKDGNVHEEHHENGNGVSAGLSDTGEAGIIPSDAENYEFESDREYEHLGNGALEVSYIEEPSETTDEASAHDHEEAIYSPVDQEHVEKPEELVRSHSPESIGPASDLQTEDDSAPESPHEVSVVATNDGKLEQGQAKDDIADIVGLLESTSFTSKHILQGSDESVTIDLPTPGSDKEVQRVGEIPDED